MYSPIFAHVLFQFEFEMRESVRREVDGCLERNMAL